MADVTKSRLIYTAGTFSIESSLAACRRFIITASVLRLPSTPVYNNERSNPPKYFLGYIGFFINSYCEKIEPLEFNPQAVLVYDNLSLQLFYSLLCTGALITDNIVKLGSVMEPPAILIPIPSPAPDFPGCKYTSLKFKLVAGTRIQVSAVGDPVVSCNGIPVNAITPGLNPPPPPYPSNRARADDPARSQPEPGELPGDTAPASLSDPDSGLSVPGTWTLTWTQSNSSTGSGTFPGVSTDTWALVSPSAACSLSGSSALVKNGSQIIDGQFNCNNFGFVSTLLSQTFAAT